MRRKKSTRTRISHGCSSSRRRSRANWRACSTRPHTRRSRTPTRTELMPFIPHTGDDVRAMLTAIGVAAIDDLFDEIPAALRNAALPGVPPGIGEMEITRLMQERAERDGRWLNFIGGGAYEHHIPAAVWQIATRGEFYSSYTPYQAEASQGTLQLLYEYQSMMTSPTAMGVTKARLYDGAAALAEAGLIAGGAGK